MTKTESCAQTVVNIAEVDATHLQTHILPEGEEVSLSVADYAAILTVQKQATQKSGWFRKTNNLEGITHFITASLGHNKQVSKVALAHCAEQKYLDLKFVPTPRFEKKRLVNARATQLGSRILDQLPDIYVPRLPALYIEDRLALLNDWLYELGHMAELLKTELPKELLDLNDRKNVDINHLPEIIADVGNIFAAMEHALTIDN